MFGFENGTLLKSVLAAMGVPFLWSRRWIVAQISLTSKRFVMMPALSRECHIAKRIHGIPFPHFRCAASFFWPSSGWARYNVCHRADMVDEGVFKGADWVKFYNVGSERGYHYLGSARIYTQMGKAFGAC